MTKALSFQTLTNAELMKQIDGVLFKQPRTHSSLYVLPIAALQDHAVDSRAL